MSWTIAILFIFLTFLAIPGAWVCLVILCGAYLEDHVDEPHQPSDPIFESPG